MQEFALGGDYIEQDDALIEVEVWVRALPVFMEGSINVLEPA